MIFVGIMRQLMLTENYNVVVNVVGLYLKHKGIIRIMDNYG